MSKYMAVITNDGSK